MPINPSIEEKGSTTTFKNLGGENQLNSKLIKTSTHLLCGILANDDDKGGHFFKCDTWVQKE